MARKGKKPPRTSLYQRFIREQLAHLEKEEPNLSHRERFQKAMKLWSLEMKKSTRGGPSQGSQ